MTENDIIIIGAGAAGLNAGLYAVRAGMKVKVLEKQTPGGQMLSHEAVENFPGFPEGIKGQELAQRLKAQAVNSGLTIFKEKARQIVFVQPSEAFSWYVVKTEGKDYTTQSIILACGAVPKRLGVPREEMLTGRGVSYSASCDGSLFRDQEVILVGEDNVAAEEALCLSKFAHRITFIHRGQRLRADKIFQDKLKAEPRIDFIGNTVVLEILGEDRVCGLKVENISTARKSEISCKGVFIFAGLKPNTDFIKGLVKMDKDGFIVTDKNLRASRKGIFACGDCRAKELHQIVVACSEGAEAAQACRNYLKELNGVSRD